MSTWSSVQTPMLWSPCPELNLIDGKDKDDEAQEQVAFNPSFQEACIDRFDANPDIVLEVVMLCFVE
jgi:hypothetical protein